MRLVIQRVKRASVSVDGKTVGEINKGLFALVGVNGNDTKKEAEFLANKLAKLRIMADKKGKMNLTVAQVEGKLLVVSQFTLYANTSKGNRPSFIKSARPPFAEKVYEHFVARLKEKGIQVETGSFGEYMEISTELDGPVTIILER